MMSTSMVNLVQSKRIDNVDQLTTALESLSSLDNLQQTQDESAVFDEDNEPTSGLINFIRKNSVQISEATPTTNDSTNTVRISLSSRFFAFEITLLVFLSDVSRLSLMIRRVFILLMMKQQSVERIRQHRLERVH